MRQLGAVAAAVAAITLLTASPARAQATTTFVSGSGLDSNPCTEAAPCRSFQHAHDQTAAGGQVTMLDTAGYGALTITKAISIVNDGGGTAGVTDPGASNDAITINAGASDVVTLRGLTLNGAGTGNNGIAFHSGGALDIQNCVIRDFANDGVLAAPAASAAVTIADTIVSGNGGTGVVMLAPSGGVIRAHLLRAAALENGHHGIFLTVVGTGQEQGAIVDSVAAGNGPTSGGDGFNIVPGTGGAVTLIGSKATHNETGVSAFSGATYISKMMITGNGVGFSVADSSLHTFGDNYIIDTNNVGSLAPIAAQ